MVRREKSQPRRALGIGRNTSPPAHHTSFASQFRAVRTVLIFRACPHGSVNASLSGSNARPPPSTLTAHIYSYSFLRIIIRACSTRRTRGRLASLQLHPARTRASSTAWPHGPPAAAAIPARAVLGRRRHYARHCARRFLPLSARIPCCTACCCPLLRCLRARLHHAHTADRTVCCTHTLPHAYSAPLHCGRRLLRRIT